MQARPEGVDPEDVVEIDFEPPTVVLPPGRREVVQADVRGGRPWFGQPKPRVLSFSLGADSPPAMATFVQRPRIGRWLISLLGLVTVAGDLRPRAEHGRRPARRRGGGRRRRCSTRR